MDFVGCMKWDKTWWGISFRQSVNVNTSWEVFEFYMSYVLEESQKTICKSWIFATKLKHAQVLVNNLNKIQQLGYSPLNIVLLKPFLKKKKKHSLAQKNLLSSIILPHILPSRRKRRYNFLSKREDELRDEEAGFFYHHHRILTDSTAKAKLGSTKERKDNTWRHLYLEYKKNYIYTNL